MQKIKVLEFFGEPLNYGGQEAFIINVYSKINKDKFDFTFMTPFECENIKLKDMISNNNDKLIFCNKEFNSNMRKRYIVETAKKYLNGNDYDVIHIHSGSVFTLYNVAKIAKKSGIKKVIVHSHCTGINSIKYRIIKFISDRFIDKYVDLYFACSKDAGMWKFPKRIVNSDKFYVIKNGIDTNKYIFNEDIRQNYRKDYNLENKHIICAIGRYDIQKNPIFTLNVFSEYLKMDKDGFLIMIGGSWDLENDINTYIKSSNLSNYVLILKNRDDIPALLNMSDVYIMPSLWEGLGIAAIEAQASGLPTLCSENIPNEAFITELAMKFELSNGEKKWAEKINELINIKRKNTSEFIVKSGFDINESVKIIEKNYCKECEK